MTLLHFLIGEELLVYLDLQVHQGMSHTDYVVVSGLAHLSTCPDP